MVDAVRTRRTHYEVLGLKPAATSDEIERAFAREMGGFRPHSIGGLTEVTLAHETLRDLAKRREYDASIGLVREKPKPTLLAWSGVGGASFSGSSLLAGRPQPVERPVAPPPAQPAAADPPPPEPPENPFDRPEPPPAQETPFIAAALRELARPEPLHEAARVPWPQPEPPQAAPEPPAAAEPDLRPALDEQLGEAEDAPIPWKRGGIVAGVLLAGVVLAGAWAGWNAGDEGKPAVNVALPPSTTFTVADPAATAPAPPAAAPSPVVEGPRSVQPKRPALAQPRAERTQSAPRLAELERQISELPQAEPGAPQAAAAEPPAEAAAAPAAVAASMPLPKSVVARTIHRIGYPCGQVASTASGGAPGVFTVTCTSGHSYQAAPVHGRYRFRRVGG